MLQSSDLSLNSKSSLPSLLFYAQPVLNSANTMTMLEAKIIVSAHLPFSLFPPKSTDGNQKLNLPNVASKGWINFKSQTNNE